MSARKQESGGGPPWLDHAVAKVLFTMRQQAGLSQRELAMRLGRSQTWVYHRESGRRRIEVADFVIWCRACQHEPVKAFEQLTSQRRPLSTARPVTVCFPP